MTSEVRFVGGPADGMTREYPGEKPPQMIQVHAPIFGRSHGSDEEIVPYQIWYETMVNPMDDGPLWVAVLVP